MKFYGFFFFLWPQTSIFRVSGRKIIANDQREDYQWRVQNNGAFKTLSHSIKSRLINGALLTFTFAYSHSPYFSVTLVYFILFLIIPVQFVWTAEICNRTYSHNFNKPSIAPHFPVGIPGLLYKFYTALFFGTRKLQQSYWMTVHKLFIVLIYNYNGNKIDPSLYTLFNKCLR